MNKHVSCQYCVYAQNLTQHKCVCERLFNVEVSVSNYCDYFLWEVENAN